MKPRRDDDAVVDLLDVILQDGVVVEADVIITVADVPLVGVCLRAAVAGMTTMNEYGMLERSDRRIRGRADRAGSVDEQADRERIPAPVASDEGDVDEE